MKLKNNFITHEIGDDADVDKILNVLYEIDAVEK